MGICRRIKTTLLSKYSFNIRNYCTFKAILLLLLCSSCSEIFGPPDPYKIYKYKEQEIDNPILGAHIELFKNTKAWELAKAVYEQDTNKILRIASHDTSLLSVTDSGRNMNLLDWAVYNYRYFSSQSLLKAGADPNFSLKKNTPFIEAAGLKYSSVFLVLLLKYGGNVKVPANANRTPLEVASRTGLENVKILIDAGADVNYVDTIKGTALMSACFSNNLDIVYYLISECGADYRRPFFAVVGHPPTYMIEILKDTYIDKNTDKYRMRQKIIDYINEHDTTDYSRPYRKQTDDSIH